MWVEMQGDILESSAQALVNPVNICGVMGAGLAKQFKKAFPANFDLYKSECDSGRMAMGKVFITAYPRPFGEGVHVHIINFPTKRHWRDNSSLEGIESGLMNMVWLVGKMGISSVAIPPLGCGLGGLLWKDVVPKIKAASDAMPGVEVRMYCPEGKRV